MELSVLWNLSSLLDGVNARWAVGGSLMLTLRGVTDVFHDIDVVVALEDMPKCEATLERQCSRLPVKPSSDVYATDRFCSFRLGDMDVDLMGGFALRHEKGVYRYPFESAGGDPTLLGSRRIPLCPLEDWYLLYQLMPNRESKVRMIEAYFHAHPDAFHFQRLTTLLQSADELPEKVLSRLQALRASLKRV